MAKRYIPKHPMATSRSGHPQVFSPDRVGVDGSVGYTYAEVKQLGKAMIAQSFRTVDFIGDGVVEEATAAPGEKRSITKTKTKAKTDDVVLEDADV